MSWSKMGLSEHSNAFGGEIKHKEPEMKTQLDKLTTMLTRSRGATSFEIIMGVGTVSPHKRLSELKERGWTITKRKVDGKNYHRYFGKKP
jgi:hypothetical protein